MCYIRKVFLLLGLIFSETLFAQENLIGYFQPKIALNYKVADNFKQNFSLGQRSYIFENEAIAFRVRQLDLAHFSNLRIKDNQSIAFGIQYRFRDNFEADEQNELRLTQQYNVRFNPRIARYGHRFRSEQRITSDLTIYRLRYRFTLDFPLQGEQLDIGEAYIIGNLEALLSVAKSNLPEYDQRFTVNIGWLLQEKTKLQTGVEYRFEDYTHTSSSVFFILTSLILAL